MCDALNFFGEHLAGPILAAIIGGPLAALTFRYTSMSRIVGDHDAEATAIGHDLRRWIRDRDRQLDKELRTLVMMANVGVISRTAVPYEDRPKNAGSMLYSGAFNNEFVAGMREALHEYRDEASRKVRAYCAIARSEGWMERLYRRRNGREPVDLKLDAADQTRIGTWRDRDHPIEKGQALSLSDDPTAEEDEIAPLETAAGLTWSAAASGATL